MDSFQHGGWNGVSRVGYMYLFKFVLNLQHQYQTNGRVRGDMAWTKECQEPVPNRKREFNFGGRGNKKERLPFSLHPSSTLLCTHFSRFAKQTSACYLTNMLLTSLRVCSTVVSTEMYLVTSMGYERGGFCLMGRFGPQILIRGENNFHTCKALCDKRRDNPDVSR